MAVEDEHRPWNGRKRNGVDDGADVRQKPQKHSVQVPSVKDHLAVHEKHLHSNSGFALGRVGDVGGSCHGRRRNAVIPVTL